MRKTTMRFPIWIVMAALLLALFLQAPAPVYASVSIDTNPSSELQVTGYTIRPSTGAINRGDELAPVTITIFDTRVTSQPSKISASLSTASFTNRGSITPAPLVGELVYDTIAPPDGPNVIGCKYTVTFSRLRYTGTGNKLSFNISYEGLSTPVQVGNVTLTLTRCVPFVPPDPPTQPGTPTPPEPDPPVEKPTDFVLKDARFGDGTVYAGERFVLSAVILATNGTFPVENVSVTFSPPEQLTLADGASVVYIGTMAPNTSTTVQVLLMAGANIPEGSYPVSISATGMNQHTGMPAGGGQMTVSIPVLQPERFEIFDAMLPTDLTAGVDDGLGFSTVTLVNKGQGTVANVTVEIEGEGLRTDIGRQYLGNVAGGEQKVADFILYADFPGVVEGKVLVLYENVRGEQMTLERPFTVTVNEMWFEDPGEWEPFPPEVPVRTGPAMWLWILIAIAAAAVVTVLLIRRRKKRLAAAEAALDEIDDEDDD